MGVRQLSTSSLNDTSNTNKDDGKKTNTDERKKKKDDANIFLDNLGKIFFGVIAAIILALVRSSRGSNNRIKLREEIEQSSLLDPSEIDDLRFINSQFSPDIFKRIMQDAISSFPNGETTYPNFLSTVLQTIKEVKGEQFTIEFGHFLDRIVIGYFESIRKREGYGGEELSAIDPSNASIPLPFLFTILSLALNSTVSERVRILFDTLKPRHDGKIDNDDEEGYEVSEESISKIIDYLQITCQLPPDAQILTSEVKYPVQEYKVGGSDELLAFAKKEISEKEKNMFSEKVTFSCKDFEAILRTTYVCAWGECYGRKRQ